MVAKMKLKYLVGCLLLPLSGMSGAEEVEAWEDDDDDESDREEPDLLV